MGTIPQQPSLYSHRPVPSKPLEPGRRRRRGGPVLSVNDFEENDSIENVENSSEYTHAR